MLADVDGKINGPRRRYMHGRIARLGSAEDVRRGTQARGRDCSKTCARTDLDRSVLP